MIYILMGVSGAGKTLIGQKLAARLDLPFYDGDNYHSDENIRKMRSGRPLSDQDRRPWLETLAGQIKQWERNGGAVLACSALKRSYREILKSAGPENIRFIHLNGTRSLIAGRIRRRRSHYMPEELLESQFSALEEPRDALTVSVDQSPEEVVESIVDRLKIRP